MDPGRKDAIAIGNHYPLPRDNLESERLAIQHKALTETVGGRLILDVTVTLEPRCRVLDSGTGSASWILDLQKCLPESAELVGSDISKLMFPDNVPSNLKLYEISSLALPDDWEHSFNFINQRMLLAAFTLEQWRMELHELYRVLKPGGAIQLMEYGKYEALYESNPIPATRTGFNYISAVYDKHGKLGLDCGRLLPGMLKEVGFSDVRVEAQRMPLGRQWGEIGEMAAQNWTRIFQLFGLECLEGGGLGLCGSQAEVDMITEQAKQEWDEFPGVVVQVYAITARKPL